MKNIDHLQTIAYTYQEICQGTDPWVALGNFMNDWFDYAKDHRAELVSTPLSLPTTPTPEQHLWAVFCAAAVEYLCEHYNVPVPEWVHDAVYDALAEAWFQVPMAHKPEVRQRLIKQTPEPFARRNIYCGNRVFANKYELAEQHRNRRKAIATLHT